MANERYTRTNQKLHFTSLALERWQQARTQGDSTLQAAERETCLLHLYGALLGLCHEVGGFYRLAGAEGGAVEVILKRPLLQASPSPELAELLELSEHSDTWLARLLRSHAALFLPLRPAPKVRQDVTQPLIEAVTLEPASDELSLEDVQGWRGQLRELVLRFRESMNEC
ncbi:PasA protein [Pseudomonas sp. ABC1]|uniref:DUF6586 family protein n=1 Tax=Pseudomonas sp. ABC1 TaxID=2748080 RepID=UPI0015C3F195|nr:DUF6586 family protein [Pseudomonas sp. ABC1]QLF94840.1 PasA protein [Pseudomonas sp. ABC1]